jgi:hypothetical protein
MTRSDPPATGTRPEDARVDELRQRLRSLGYLDAGVDRFVLGPARGARRPLAIAALASIRVGLLAAVLLGPAAAVGIATRLPGLVTGAADATIVALYLALLFGVAAAIVSFTSSLLVARTPLVASSVTRPQWIARLAGAVVGAGCLVYLTLWWRIASVDAAAIAPAWTIFVLVIAVAISLLLGHAASITAFAVIVAGHADAGAHDVERRSAWRLTAVAAIAAFAGAAALLLVTTTEGADDPGPAPNLAVVSPGARVTLVAIDGFDPAVLESLGGQLPNLSALLGGGARLDAGAVRDPAREWTTVSTGQPPDVHGVQGLETRRVAGLQGSVTTTEAGGLLSALRGATDLLRLTRPSTASVADLRSKTIWEVAADAGLRAGVVNWWATWPATLEGANPPIVVSDRATLRLERGGALDGEIAPEATYDRLRAEWPGIREEVSQAVSRMLPANADPATRESIRRAAEVDALQLAMASRLEPPRLDFLAIYLPGLDIAQYALLGSGESISPSQLAARLEALRGYYAYLDGLLTAFAARRDGDMVVAVAQPGRIATIAHGLVAVSGAGAAAGARALEIRAVDIAPTVLHALGIAVSRELAGRPVVGLFSEAFAARYPVREIDTYGRRAASAAGRSGQPLDREMIDRLRSLGYVR